MKKEYKIYIEHIYESALYIQEYTAGLTYNEFINDRKTVDAVIRNFEIIGEAGASIPSEIRQIYSEIPWKRLVGFRNILIHQYMGIDFTILWEHVQVALPELIQKLREVLDTD